MFERLKYERYMDSCSKLYRRLNDVRANTAIHFCTMQTLDAILESGFLRAVDSRFMNDLGEYEFGSQVLKRKIKKAGETSNVVPLTVSFSTESDLTPQWFLYAKESGIGIEFDFDFQRYWTNDPEDGTIYVEGCEPSIAQVAEDGRFINTQIPYPINIIYLKNTAEENEELDKLVEALDHICKKRCAEDIPADLKEVLPLAATFIKSSDFSYEKEARISTFVFQSANGTGPRSKVRFHANGTYLRPFVDICFIRNDTEPQNIGWPISAIWVGPGRNQQKTVESVIKRLEFGTVKTFAIPYDVFLQRLCEYIKDLLISAVAALAKGKSNKLSFSALAEELTQDLFEEDARYQTRDGKKYHLCVDADGYAKVKSAMGDLRGGVIQKLQDITGRSCPQIQQWLSGYEKENYFSWHGIRVRTSVRKLSFV